MHQVIFYTKEICSLCEDGYALLLMFQNEYGFEIEERDIYSKDDWLLEYQLQIPVVEINGKQINCEKINTETGYEALEKFIKENIHK